ncbi:hypothetical protein F0562_031539 [Nyssa sinensis]|uniref:Helicase C-terminal domain-containing protein n=1 Tax=Nyssa sinensis TaxID=561372 RepID=A0A5J5AW73_9ASTE|nr:hypothetical protein F0562_031539 [Nyssa sinensis]
MKKRQLHQSTHPFDACPFEAFCYGSWKTVERLRIKDGAITMHFVDSGVVEEENIPISNLRIRSRRATLSDCTCFLRPGLDICVLSTPQHAENSGEEENLEPVWLDAKINSIERKPHESTCACQFYVSFYVAQGPQNTAKKTLSKEINMVQFDQISILQKLGRNPCENEHFRWNFSEDCLSLQKYKLFTGRFSCDLTWLVVASVLKQIVFDVRSIQNKIVYHIWEADHDKCPPNSDKHSKAVNFKLENGIAIPILVPFVPVNTLEEGLGSDMHEIVPLSDYDLTDLRRSKRRYVQPERYFGCDDLLESDIEVARIGTCKTLKWEYEEMPLALSIQADHAYHSDKTTEDRKRVRSYKKDFYENFLLCQSEIKSRERRLVVANQIEEDPQLESSQLAIVPVPTEADDVVIEEDPLDYEIPGNHSEEIGEIISKYIYINGTPKVRRKNTSETKFLEFGGGWAGKGSHKRYQRRRYHSIYSERENFRDTRSFGKRSMSASVYRELIRRCMKNIESTINKEQPLIIDQWKEFRAANTLNERDSTDTPSVDKEEENSEIEMLWKEMELSIASSYLLEDNENDFQGSNIEVPAEILQKSSRHGGQVCLHEYKLDEEIGILCQLCGFVSTEIKDVSPSFFQCTNWITNMERRNLEDSKQKLDGDSSLDLLCLPASTDMPLSEGKDNVWALIPDLKRKLRFHQKRAFEFLWRNIAGSIVPALMEPASKNRVYQIHGGRTYRGQVLRQQLKLSPGINQDVMHILDCLEKIQKWLSQPSVLLMGYTSFLTLTRDDSRFAHRQYMAQVLRQSPGILILDEGHNPRSTKSRLRKGLMKVDTGLRVLLSGTLFQNNFGEYFNTLCLARPSFVNEVLRELDPRFKRRKKGAQTRFSLENRARKFFIDKIAKKIDSGIAKERMQGLNMLKNLTSGFIDVHEGGSSDNLPGLQSYTLMMKSTTIQQDILVKLQNQRPIYKGFPLELELLITLGSIHPWLIRTTACASQYFNIKELEDLDKYKFDLKLGSKVKFVMSLVPRCIIRKEKVLIFCHNIAPINLFLEIFETFYGWQKGEEVLVLQGDLELFERGRVMDKFEEPGGASKVLLASITACAEGISLTAASRVILLDSEWNPSKSKQAIARAFRPGQDKVVYVYQLLATGTLEEEKHSRTTWKEWVSSMIFSEEHVEDPSHWQAEKIEDDILREIVEEDRATLFHMIMKNEKASNGLVRGK